MLSHEAQVNCTITTWPKPALRSNNCGGQTIVGSPPSQDMSTSVALFNIFSSIHFNDRYHCTVVFDVPGMTIVSRLEL